MSPIFFVTALGFDSDQNPTILLPVIQKKKKLCNNFAQIIILQASVHQVEASLIPCLPD
jgi:hypothetical protein